MPEAPKGEQIRLERTGDRRGIVRAHRRQRTRRREQRTQLSEPTDLSSQAASHDNENGFVHDKTKDAR